MSYGPNNNQRDIQSGPSDLQNLRGRRVAAHCAVSERGSEREGAARSQGARRDPTHAWVRRPVSSPWRAELIAAAVTYHPVGRGLLVTGSALPMEGPSHTPTRCRMR